MAVIFILPSLCHRTKLPTTTTTTLTTWQLRVVINCKFRATQIRCEEHALISKTLVGQSSRRLLSGDSLGELLRSPVVVMITMLLLLMMMMIKRILELANCRCLCGSTLLLSPLALLLLLLLCKFRTKTVARLYRT